MGMENVAVAAGAYLSVDVVVSRVFALKHILKSQCPSIRILCVKVTT
jgi:hypothetical protein